MWFVAFFPDPPAPITLILAKASISGVMLGIMLGGINTPIITDRI